MLWTNPFNLQHVGNLLQSSLQVLATLHQILHIIDVGEVKLQGLKELVLPLWQVDVCQQ